MDNEQWTMNNGQLIIHTLGVMLNLFQHLNN